MERLILRIALLLGVFTTGWLLSAEHIPLGVPGEWTWDRIAVDTVTEVGAVLALLAGFVYVVFAAVGGMRVQRAGGLERCGWLCLLVIAAFSWMWACVDAPPPPHGYARTPWILYYPRSSGYFWQARYEVEDTSSFLSNYEELLAEGNYLHIGTHPPGLTLAYRSLLHLCHRWPRLTDALLASQPSGVRDSIATMRESPISDVPPIAATDAACLWLAVLLTQLAAALTSLGIYSLAARHVDRRAAWMAACLWPLVPASLVFLPKSDVLYALPAVTAAWLWMSACDRGSALRALLAGLVIWGGMFLSLAFLSVAALIGVMSLWEAWTATPESPRGAQLSLRLVFIAAIGFGVPVAWLASSAEINLFNVWWWNLKNHASFYEHNVRTYQAWLLANPIELSMSVGLPIVTAAIWGAWRLFRSGLKSPRASSLIAFLIVWGLLWISGKNMGEAARLWILIMPWVVLIAASGLQRCEDLEGEAPSRLGRLDVWLLAAQCLIAVMTIMQVDGFHFGQLLTG